MGPSKPRNGQHAPPVKFNMGEHPKHFFGYIAITWPRIDVFCPNLVRMRGKGIRKMYNGQHISDLRSHLGWGMPLRCGVIRDNSAAD